MEASRENISLNINCSKTCFINHLYCSLAVYHQFQHSNSNLKYFSAFQLFRDLLQSAVSCFIACACIIYSTYLSSIIQASYFLSFRWTNAYAQSQSFRFSHYFVGFFSQAMHQAIGFAAVTNPKS